MEISEGRVFFRKVRVNPGRGGKSNKDCLLLITNDALIQKTVMTMNHLFGLTGSCLFRGHVGTLLHL